MRIYFANGKSTLININTEITVTQLCTLIADKLHLEPEAVGNLEVLEVKKNDRKDFISHS